MRADADAHREARADERRATDLLAAGDMQRERRHDDRDEHRQERHAHVIGDLDRQREREHADEVHRPDADAHRDAAADEPGRGDLPTRHANAQRERQRRVGRQDGDQHRDQTSQW